MKVEDGMVTLKAALKPFVPARVRKLPHVVLAAKNGLTRRIQVPDSPHFDPKGLTYFLNRIKSCKRYLEYGCGGSTVAVARLGIPFTSIESDARFLAAVRAKIGSGNRAAERRLIAVDIGMTGDWGYPVFTDMTPRRVARWSQYPLAPWPMPKLPDLILIDGRFRVACALTTIKHLYDKIDFEILFDDYSDRDFYHGIEEFACLHAMHGRMAVFKQKPVSMSDLDSAIERFATDFR